jgi:hypothetical protein
VASKISDSDFDDDDLPPLRFCDDPVAGVFGLLRFDCASSDDESRIAYILRCFSDVGPSEADLDFRIG